MYIPSTVYTVYSYSVIITSKQRRRSKFNKTPNRKKVLTNSAALKTGFVKYLSDVHTWNSKISLINVFNGETNPSHVKEKKSFLSIPFLRI